jgi:branched-chain amino acid transport system substrate-binding protein
MPIPHSAMEREEEIMRRGMMLMVAALGVWALAAAPAPAQTIKVGAAVALTGNFSHEGTQVYRGYQLWLEEVNKQGINVGGKRMKVEMVFYDDKSEAQTAVDLTEKLITQDKVQFILGPFSSPITQQTSVIGEKYKILTMAPQANSDTIYERGFKYVFSVLPPASSYFRSFLEMGAKLSPRPKTLAILAGNQPFTLLAAQGTQEHAKRLGYEVVYNDKYPAPATDLSAFLTQIKAKNPDVVVVASFFQASVLATKQAKELRLCPKMMAFSVGPELPSFSKELGKDAEFVVGSAWWLPTMGWKGPDYGSAKDYAKRAQDKYGEPAGYHIASGTAAGQLLQMAIEKAGSTETDKVRAALLGMDVETFWGPTKWAEDGKNVKGGQGIIQIQDGKITTVYPDPIREKGLVYPVPCWDKR